MITNLKKPQFIVDEKGNRTAVILDIKLYEELLEAAEELDDIRAYDEAEARNEEAIPFEQAIKDIENARH
jgi:hypothetical protein